MELQTFRLLIKELSVNELETIHHLHSFPQIDEFNTLGIPGNIQTTQSLLSDWIQQQNSVPRISYTFSVLLSNTNDFVGLIALNLGKFKV